jgi:hypothetical protein
MENVRACPSGSLAPGVKLYSEPTVTEVAGLPLIVGGPSAAAMTVSVNAGSEAARAPLLTLIVMFGKLPIFAEFGVPESRPVLALNVIQEGWF